MQDVFLTKRVRYLQSDSPFKHKHDTLAHFVDIDDLGPFLVVLLLHVVVDLAEEPLLRLGTLLLELIGVEAREVVDLVEELDLELLPLIFVLHGVLLQLDEDVLEALAHVEEDGLVDAGHGAVVRALDCGSSWSVCQKGQLTEVVTL